MRFLLDTNAVAALLNGNLGDEACVSFASCRRDRRLGHRGLELYFGAFRSSKQTENLASLEGLSLAVVAFAEEDARRAGEIRAALARVGTPIGPYDVLIAGQAVARGLILVTNNMREFQRVPGLAVEDWQS